MCCSHYITAYISAILLSTINISHYLGKNNMTCFNKPTYSQLLLYYVYHAVHGQQYVQLQ